MREGAGERPRDAGRRLGASIHHYGWVPAFCLWVAFVWGRSLVRGPESSLESSRVVAVVAPILNALGIAGEAGMGFAVQKAAHFLEYAVLGALGVPAFLWPARDGRRPRWLGPLVVALVPVVDETIQLFVPGREASPRDVLIDLCGAAVGTLVAALVSRRRGAERPAEGAARR